ncbi:MFS transporter [Variovorax sp. PBL-E5]|uniref:MFS transporter n=1 Tax=Variovorax sp. PBL-E5 TaxID=434014 RepID=UPI001316208A|nr:MFS transporter [Variovorax sp. PBL-E5]VTU39684.1 multidrug resistance protein D [Variovorax sp. PBL-E5]
MTTLATAGASFTLGRRASFWVSAAVVGHTLWTSAAPACTYPLYAAQWHLTPTVITSIFAVYPITVVAALLLFGNLSDQIGRRATMLLGLAASLLGVLLFAAAPSVAWIFVGRFFMGVGVGLSTSPATAALVEFSAAGQSERANAVATIATAVGLAAATLIGGGLIQYAPFPTHLNFWVLFAVLAALFGATWFLPRHAATDGAARWRPGAVSVPKSIRWPFAISAVAVTGGYALGALFLSLGTQVAHDLIGSANALVNGAAIALFATVTGAVTLAAKRLSANTSIVLGGLSSAAGMGLLALSANDHSLPVFLVGLAFGGAAYSLQFRGGLTMINASASPAHRAGTLSAIFLIGYLLMGAIAMALGISATAWGLRAAIDVGAPGIGLIGLLGVVLVAWNVRLPVRAPVAAPRLR